MSKEELQVIFEFWGGSFINQDDQDQFIRDVFVQFKGYNLYDIELGCDPRFTVKNTPQEKIESFIETVDWYLAKDKIKNVHYRLYHIIKEV